MVFKFCRRVWARFVETAVFAGALEVPRYERRRQEVLACARLPPKWDWVDPAKDTKAEIEQIAAGLKSRTQALAERATTPSRWMPKSPPTRRASAGSGSPYRQPSASPDPAPQDEASAKDAPASPADAAPAT